MIEKLKNKLKQTLRPTYHTIKKLAKSTKRPLKTTAGKLIFSFGGREECWPGMGRELYNNEPVFRKTIQQCNDCIVSIGGNEIISYFEGPLIENYFKIETNFICGCAIQIATFETISSKGIYPDAVLGISMGELAAMYAAGANSLEDSMKICANWLNISQTEKEAFCIINIDLGIKDAEILLKDYTAPASILFEVSETSTLLSLANKDVDDLDTFLNRKQISLKKFDKPFLPYHTPLMEKFKLEFDQVDKKSLTKPLICDYYSPSLPGILKKNTFVHTDYWHRVLSAPMFFHTMLRQIAKGGYGSILQIGLPSLGAWNLKDINIEKLSSFKSNTGEIENFRTTYENLIKCNRRKSTFSDKNEVDRFGSFKENFDVFTLNPPAAFEYLRKAGDVHYIPTQNSWLILSYDLADSIIKQPHLFSSSISKRIDATLLGAEPEPHRIIRDLVQPLFSPGAINEIAVNFKSKAVKCFDELLKKDEFDFFTDASNVLTQSVLFDFWGYTAVDSTRMFEIIGTDPHQQSYYHSVTDYFDKQLKLSGHELGDTIPGKIRSFIDKGLITHNEAVSLAKLIWSGGVHTSVVFNSSIFNTLMNNPEVTLQLQNNEKLIPIFVGECLRLMPTANFLSRITTEPVELNGLKIPADARLILSIDSVNRDPAHFTEPDELLLNRPAKRNLSFGAGIHQCLGMGVARAIAIALTNVILERINDFNKYKINAPRYHQLEETKIITSLSLKRISSN